MRLRLRYFAWLRERVGRAGGGGRDRRRRRSASWSTSCAARDEAHALAFADLRAVRVAVDEELADLAAPLAGVREVAFFPPMTGG